MSEEFELIINSDEPPTGGQNVTARYGGGMRMGCFSLATVREAVVALHELLHEPTPNVTALAQHGATLYRALFADTIGEGWRAALAAAATRNARLRLRIYTQQPALIAIPWEYLYDESTAHWLALRSELSLVRGLPLQRRPPQPVAGLLRVLVMVAAPTDQPPLDSARELANLQAATATAAIELIPIEPTFAALQAALRQQPHGLHFIGHGFFPATAEATAQGTLAFCNADGQADYVAADRLAPLLAGCTSLGLVVLNACQGAVTNATSAFAGLAQQLLQQGVPAVIAMQAPILDTDALSFSREFYAALADGYGIEQAVGQGRMAIHGAAYTWGIPAFYLQAEEPLVVPQLSAAQKAERLWQRLAQSADPAARRPLVEQILALVPDHVGAKGELARLTHEAQASPLYAAAQSYMATNAWRDAYVRLSEVERLAPNYQQTRRFLAQVKGQLDGKPLDEAQWRGQVNEYRAIEEALKYGRLVPFLGWDISRFGRPAADGWVEGLYPPVADEAAQALADRLPEARVSNPSLPEISQYATILSRQWALYDGLTELYQAGYAPSLLHRLLAELPGRLRGKGYPIDPKRRLIIFSTALDQLLETAFQQVEQPYHLFAYHHPGDDGPALPCFVHHNPQGEAMPLLAPTHDPNSYQGHLTDQHPIIIKLCGQGVAAAPERLIVTEDHYLNRLPQEIGALLPMTLLDQLRPSNLLCLGYSLRPWYFRLLWQRLRLQQRRLLQGGWAIVPNPTRLEEAFWDDQRIALIQAAPEAVVAYVNEWLDQLEVRR